MPICVLHSALAANGVELPPEAVRQLLTVSELMYRPGPARAAASALEAIATASPGHAGILATPAGLQCAAGLAGLVGFHTHE